MHIYNKRGQIIYTSEEDTLKWDELCNVNLEGANLKGADLTGFQLENVNLYGADLSGANLKKAYLIRVNLEDTDLNNANLTLSFMQDSYLASADIKEADLTGSRIISCNLSYTNFSMANLSDVIITSSLLYQTHFNNATLKGATFHESHMSNIDSLIYATCTWTDFGVCGRQILCIVIDSVPRYICGCFEGTEEQTRKYISNGQSRFKESRTLAVDFLSQRIKEMMDSDIRRR